MGEGKARGERVGERGCGFIFSHKEHKERKNKKA